MTRIFYVINAAIYVLLTLICLSYAAMAFVDIDTMSWARVIDLPKLIAGVGTASLCVFGVVKYVKLIKNDIL